MMESIDIFLFSILLFHAILNLLLILYEPTNLYSVVLVGTSFAWFWENDFNDFNLFFLE